MTPCATLNGIHAVTGRPLLPPLSAGELLGQPGSPDQAAWLGRLARRLSQPHLGLPWGWDARNLAQVGWGLVVADGENEPVRRALEPLVEHRRVRLGDRVVRVLDYQPGESWRTWLARHGAEPGSVRPEKVPFYLLLVGPPTVMSFEFEQMLSLEYAVGRLSFEEPEEYRLYVESLLAFEQDRRFIQFRVSVPEKNRLAPRFRVRRNRLAPLFRALVFGTCHAGDGATRLSCDELARPLAAHLAASGFAVEALLGEAASKERLLEALEGSSRRPSLLFTATHGLGWPSGAKEQARRQGALLCQDWPGGPPEPRVCIAAEDVSAAARLHGLVSFHFGCFTAGTPAEDAACPRAGPLAPKPLVAALPRRLLAHPGGGALGVFGHVDRAWGYSIVGQCGQAQRLPFENALARLAAGWPLGLVLRDFRERFAVLSAALADPLERRRFGEVGDEAALAALWVERHDARGYTLLGDPAAALLPADGKGAGG